jgi:FkbM family methyltransferase
MFDPRGNDVAGLDFVVVVEVWQRNDYLVSVEHGFQGGTVLDVGANVGAFTVLAAKAGAGRVVAVEPEPENFSRLRHHVQLNRVGPKVELVNAAVTTERDAVVDVIGWGGGAHVDRDAHRVDPEVLGKLRTSKSKVSTIRLDDLIEENAPIEMMKMDIEGGEFPIFEDLDVDVLRNVGRISMEWHGPASPHLSYLRGDEFGGLVMKLADAGTLSTVGHPRSGGLLHWHRY